MENTLGIYLTIDYWQIFVQTYILNTIIQKLEPKQKFVSLGKYYNNYTISGVLYISARYYTYFVHFGTFKSFAIA